MRHILIFSLSVLIFVSSKAQDFAQVTVPDSLLESANAVIVNRIGTFHIQSVNRAHYTEKIAIKILNEKGRNEALFAEYYDKLSSINNIEYRVYDEDGNQLHKAKQADIYDRSAVSGYSLYEDDRVKLYIHEEEFDFPYTVEYSFEKQYKYLYGGHQWSFMHSEGVSTLASSYTFIYPESVGARIKENNFNGTRNESQLEDSKKVTWSYEGIPTSRLEPYIGNAYDLIPHIEIVPLRFEYDGYAGDMSTWDSYGKWISSLNRGLDPLPATFQQKLVNETKTKSELEKTKYIYEYLQENTRYVSIQLGIGGLKPFSPSITHEMGYGDCKALTYYTKSMLEAVGVASYYTLIESGDYPSKINPEFPIDNFNHIILCVPMDQDTIWLECTSQTNPFGYLGSFTGDRQALLIDENGAKIVNTTSYPDDGNIDATRVNAKIWEDGSSRVTARMNLSGMESEYYWYLLEKGIDERKEEIGKIIDIPTHTIETFSIDRNEQEQLQMDLSLVTGDLVSKSGSRMFIQPNILSKHYFVPLKNPNRKESIVVKNGYLQLDTVSLEIPQGFSLEAAFDPITITSEFGEYKAEIKKLDDGSILYVRRYLQHSGTYEKSKYSSFLNFHKKVSRADKKKVAIIKKT